jgi:FkbM family methyltransferase
MNEKYAISLVDQSDVPLDLNDTIAAKKLQLVYDIIDFDQIKQVCDVGSRFLEQTVEMSYIFKEAKFYAFEPVPSSYRICSERRESLDPEFRDRIKIYNYAVGDTNGKIPFYPVNDAGSEFNVGASSKYKFVPGLNGSFFGKTWNQDEIEVQQITLDEWRESNNIGPIDMIWIDVQGAELDAFRGARETLKDVKLIMTEVGLGSYYQGQSLKPDIDAFLQSCGFKELTDCFERCFEYEGNAVYVKE